MVIALADSSPATAHAVRLPSRAILFITNLSFDSAPACACRGRDVKRRGLLPIIPGEAGLPLN